jgi:hypothetical protein
MTYQTFIKRGKAVLAPNGLRCQGPRTKDPTQTCNKLLVKKNSLGQVAGSFKCERCDQEIEVELAMRP